MSNLDSRRAAIIWRAVAHPAILEQWLRDLATARLAAAEGVFVQTWGRVITMRGHGHDEMPALEVELRQQHMRHRSVRHNSAPEFVHWSTLHSVCRALLLVITGSPPDETARACVMSSFETAREDFEVAARRMTNWQRAEIDRAWDAAIDAEAAQLDDLERRLAAVAP
jgi:hypothetical protein